MAKEKKYQVLTDEDIKIIESDPSSLADYVVRTKVKETKKTALIFAILFTVLSFGAGVFVGMNLTKSSIPDNVIQIQVGSEDQTLNTTSEEGK